MALTLGTNVGFVTTAPTADPAGTDVVIDGASVVVKDTSPAGAVKITEIGWYRGSGTNAANFEVALYSDTAGVADARLFVDATNSSTTQGWITVAVDWTISPSTTYWLGLQMDAHTGSSNVDSATSGGSGIDRRTTQTTLNNPYGGGAVADADGMYAIYALTTVTTTYTQNNSAKASIVVTNPNYTTDTYYFDASDAGPTDPNSAWTSDANAFDGSTATLAANTAYGSTSSNYLLGEGTNAPTTGLEILQVRARAYGSGTFVTKNAAIYTDSLGEALGTAVAGHNEYGAYITLTTPSGGWTWAKIAALETKLYCVGAPDGSGSMARVEIEVTHRGFETTSYTIGALGNKIYTREGVNTLETAGANLTTSFTSTEVSDVDTANDTRVEIASTAVYRAKVFKYKHTNNTDPITVTWEGQVDLAPSSSTVYLQIYNRNSSAWETIDSDNTSSANTDFTLTGTISTSVSNYYDSNNWVTARVYQ